MIVERPLPIAPNEALEQSRLLTNYLRRQMDEKDGAIPFSEYFNECLYHPTLGYYTSNLPKFGGEGDFVTAPLISPYFSYCLGNQIIEIFKVIDNPVIIELGAGSGIMAKDILEYLKQHNALPHKYYILEISGALKTRQQALLEEAHPDFFEHIIWLDEPLTDDWQGVLLANEVIDALAVERFTIKNGEPFYMDVAYTIDDIAEDHSGDQLELVRFETVLRESDLVLKTFIDELFDKGISLPNDYESEYCALLKPWLNSVTKSMVKGVALFIDYGHSAEDYYQESRFKGTMIAHYQHHVHDDLYIYSGIQDLTANVDFTRLAESALDLNFDLIGYTTQTYFLYGAGLEALLTEAQATITEINWYKTAQAVQKLISPDEMGERFKVMALGRGVDVSLRGFELNELSHQL